MPHLGREGKFGIKMLVTESTSHLAILHLETANNFNPYLTTFQTWNIRYVNGPSMVHKKIYQMQVFFPTKRCPFLPTFQKWTSPYLSK